jgi:polyisoprenoid-binding protein YceI
MKKWLPFFVLLIIGLTVRSQTYLPIDNRSQVNFSIKNFGFAVNGNLKGLKGRFIFNPANLPAAVFNASVAAATINTGNGLRDSHLKRADYFDVVKFPLISFVSTKITGTKIVGNFLMEGDITVRDITQKITFPFTAIPNGDGYLLAGSFVINRRDFGVGGGSMVLSDHLTVSLTVVAKKY